MVGVVGGVPITVDKGSLKICTPVRYERINDSYISEITCGDNSERKTITNVAFSIDKH